MTSKAPSPYVAHRHMQQNEIPKNLKRTMLCVLNIVCCFNIISAMFIAHLLQYIKMHDYSTLLKVGDSECKVAVILLVKL